jgi:hypothetical protein
MELDPNVTGVLLILLSIVVCLAAERFDNARTDEKRALKKGEDYSI